MKSCACTLMSPSCAYAAGATARTTAYRVRASVRRAARAALMNGRWRFAHPAWRLRSLDDWRTPWSGGERGIRTLEGLLTLTPLAGVRLRPLGHLSAAKETWLLQERVTPLAGRQSYS